MSTKMIAFGAIVLVIVSIAENASGNVPVRPPRPDSFKTEAEVKQYVKMLKEYVAKGGNRYGKRNTFSDDDIQTIEENGEEDVDQPIYKEYAEPSVQHPQHRYYPEWLKQVMLRSSQRMWY